MIFGKSILPTTTSRWSYSLATTTGRQFDIAPGGWVRTTLTVEDVPVLPGIMRLNIMADRYASLTSYETVVDILIENKDGRNYNIVVPIVNTGKNMYSVDIDFTNSEYKTFSFVIKSLLGIKITSCELLTPSGSDNTAIIEELRGELPRLLYDYNKTPLVVDYKEQTIALISAWLVRDTDLNGHIQLTYTATHATQLIIRCKDNDISELFTPILYDIKPGRGSIGIPHAYLEKKIGFHTFTVSAQVKEGSLTFATRAIIYTIDGGHLASRVMDVGMNVRDIALRRTALENEPSWIYAIGIDRGIASVRARPHSEIASIAWEPQFEIGEALEAAIEFDGDWALVGMRYRPETDGEPWIFWVDFSNTLWGQYSSDESTRWELATGVQKISAVLGWRNPTFVTLDQGMIVAYIKGDGLVYYRNYCMIVANQQRGWEKERQLEEFEGTAIDIKIFRTNDYRVGFNVLTDTNVTRTYLTERNWVGMAIAPEKFSVRAKAAIDLLPVTYHRSKHDHTFTLGAAAEIAFLFGRTDNSLIDVKNVATTRTNEAQEEYQDYGFAVEITLNYKTVTTPIITIRDSKTLGYYSVLEVQTIRDGYEYRAVIDDTIDEFGFNIAEEKLTINITGFSNAAGYNYDTINQEFTPTGLEAPILGVPEVEVIYNE